MQNLFFRKVRVEVMGSANINKVMRKLICNNSSIQFLEISIEKNIHSFYLQDLFYTKVLSNGKIEVVGFTTFLVIEQQQKINSRVNFPILSKQQTSPFGCLQIQGKKPNKNPEIFKSK